MGEGDVLEIIVNNYVIILNIMPNDNVSYQFLHECDVDTKLSQINSKFLSFTNK